MRMSLKRVCVELVNHTLGKYELLIIFVILINSYPMVLNVNACFIFVISDFEDCVLNKLYGLA